MNVIFMVNLGHMSSVVLIKFLIFNETFINYGVVLMTQEKVGQSYFKEKEIVNSYHYILVLSYFHLALCIVAIHFLIKTKFAYLPESVAVVVLGAMVGGLIKIMNVYNVANWQVIFICYLTSER